VVHRGSVAAQTRGRQGVVVRSSEQGVRSLQSIETHRRGWRRERGEHGDPVLGLIGARATVWWPGDGEAVAAMKLNGDSAQARREGIKRSGKCDEKRSECLPLIGAVGHCGEVVTNE
jgi:hypothetical protein